MTLPENIDREVESRLVNWARCEAVEYPPSDPAPPPTSKYYQAGWRDDATSAPPHPDEADAVLVGAAMNLLRNMDRPAWLLLNWYYRDGTTIWPNGQKVKEPVIKMARKRLWRVL